MEPNIVIDPGRGLGNGFGLWLAPIVLALGLVAFIVITGFGLSRTIAVAKKAAPGKRVHVDPAKVTERPEHEVAGGFYHYQPGMYSHSYSVQESAAMAAAEERAETERAGAKKELQSA